MMKKLKYIVAITIIIIIMLTGCGNHEKAWPPDDPAQMPGIVFIVDYYYKTLPGNAKSICNTLL